MVTDAEWRLAGEVEPSVALTPIPQADAIVAGLKPEGERLLSYAQGAEVTDLATAKSAANDITLIRTTAKLLEEKRKAYKAPLLEAGRELDRFFNEIAEPFKAADATYTKKVTDYHKAEEAKRKEAEAINKVVGEEVVEVADQQKRVRAETGTLTFVPPAAKEKIQAAVDAGVREIPGVAIYPVWQFKVLDIKQVPEEYRKMGTRVTR